MTIQIETREEFEKLCNKVVNTNMFKLKIEDETKVVALLMSVFDISKTLAIEGKVEVEI